MIDGRPLVDLHLPHAKGPLPEDEFVDERLSQWGRAELMVTLEGLGAAVSVSRGREAFLDTREAHVFWPRVHETEGGNYSVQVHRGPVAPESIDAIRNTTRVLGRELPELNHPRVRAVARDKGTANDVLSRRGLAKEYAIVDANSSFEDALQVISGNRVVAKPRMGSKSKGIVGGTKAELAAMMRNGALVAPADGLIVEQMVDFSAPLPVRGRSSEDQIRIDTANKEGVAKELRQYLFGRDADGAPITSHVMRAALPGDQFVGRNDWIFVDPESVPIVIHQLGGQVLSLIEQETGTQEVHMVTDWVRDGGDDQWRAMEINASEPQLVFRHEHPEVAAEHAGKLAAQLMRVAVHGGTAVNQLQSGK